MSEPDGNYWYCLNHKRVEGREGCRAADRIGPFATENEAAHALELIQERNKRYDAEDEAESNGA
ncbi:MAG TPA: hypothetical protein VHC49_10760 [Mycobacteriales bacterium]|nr:hypothetical protein [Mycobacteriales bacterium]